MSHLPFADPNVAAATLSNLAIYKATVTLTGGAATPYNVVLGTTEAHMGQFVPVQVWFHVESNSGLNTLTFTASVGHNAAAYDNVCASAPYGSAATVDTQLRQYKAVLMGMRVATGKYNCATPANTATPLYLRVSASPASTIVGTVFVVGFYTGARP